MSLKQATTALDRHDYPATSDQLADSYDDYELDLPNGTESLGEVFARGASETFADAREAQATMYSAVSSKAIGREGYSDRDPTVLGTDGPGQVSF
ncbi:DUF5789 family protein [Halorussus marinus]|uniref:DUF5789 family protein n=1 Tax=Halorussus marinus TaxID=2505976 RepID=UPI00106EE67C|nr:DUF2795 domain-containing protein [Halorussus marinus]